MNEIVTQPAVPADGYESPTLRKLPRNRRPDPGTVCEFCPAAVWMAAPTEVKCYCRIIHLIAWSTAEPNVLTHCDGEVMANAQRLEDASG